MPVHSLTYWSNIGVGMLMVQVLFLYDTRPMQKCYLRRMCNNVLTCTKNVCYYHDGSAKHRVFSSYDVVYVIVEHSEVFLLARIALHFAIYYQPCEYY